MTSIKGVQRIAMAILAMVSTSAIAEACSDTTEANYWRIRLLMLDNAAVAGPPEIARAATAFRAGHRNEGLDLLATAGRISNANLIRPPINRPFVDAVLTARETVWELHGCPAD